MFVWEIKKNEWLKKHRGVSFEEVEQILCDGRQLGEYQNPAHPHQRIFVVVLHGYAHIVPFIYDAKDNVVLKTIYPSRKYQKLYAKKTTP